MHRSIGKTAVLLGVSISTLRRWEAEGYFIPAYGTAGGHRRYALAQIESKFERAADPIHAKAVAYARVSSHDQRKDLETQKSKLEGYCKEHFASFEVLTDLGSGLNYRKPGLKKLLKLIFQRKMSHLILNHKDPLLRFGADLVFDLCRHFGVEVSEKKRRLCPSIRALSMTKAHPSLFRSYESPHGRFREILYRQNPDAPN